MTTPATTKLEDVLRVHNETPFPYIVVGSGIGGGMLARHLLQKGHRVLVIEKGGIKYPTHCLNSTHPRADHKGTDPSRPGKDNEVAYQLARNGKEYKLTDDSTADFGGGPVGSLGGRSLFWTLETPQIVDQRIHDYFPESICEYLIEDGYARAQRVMANSPPGDAEYPWRQSLTHPEQEQAVLRAKYTLKRVLDEFCDQSALKTRNHSIGLAPNAAEFATGNQLYYSPQGAYSTADFLLDRLFTGDDRLAVLCDYEVITIGSHDSRQGLDLQKIQYINIRRSNSKDQFIQLLTSASQVILCGGTIETPAIALRSGFGRSPYIGKQPTSEASLVDDPRPEPSSAHGSSIVPVSSLIGRGLTDHELWNTRFWNTEDPMGQPVALKARVKIPGDSAPRGSDGHNALLTLYVHNEKFYAHSFATGEAHRQAPPIGQANVLMLVLEFETRDLDEESFVSLDESFHTQLTLRRKPMDDSNKFKESLLALAKIVHEKFGYAATGSALPTPAVGKFGFVAHEVGTMRIQSPKWDEGDSTGDSHGVVNENLRAHGMENLFVCDLSVFRISPQANPSLTLGALAMRLGDYLSEYRAQRGDGMVRQAGGAYSTQHADKKIMQAGEDSAIQRNSRMTVQPSSPSAEKIVPPKDNKTAQPDEATSSQSGDEIEIRAEF